MKTAASVLVEILVLACNSSFVKCDTSFGISDVSIDICDNITL